ncbi:uncharacterized protein JCM15063_006030 [Sporobolomyces koalae]|uniref:uncharacterized protein n=1 Tax=Sporobolomyces koalae TaxID=500713 RepID=UPI003175D68B
MPGKHALIDHDGLDNGLSSASSPKRHRKASSLPNLTPPAERDQDMSIATSPPQEQEQDQDEEGALSDDNDEDAEQNRRALEELQATQAMRSLNPKIAQAGVITRVKLENFMCHYSTEVDFGPQVNFLVGVNGSGKSAILTGITMALGGNAKATNRAAKGAELVMEGRTSAKCSVTLANRGKEAFKPDQYGDEITIERSILKAGGGGYRIKNDDGKTVCTKKATLDSILDHFNLQVDNPMTVLTQDQSRQFLAKASARDKYNFFLRGTQLAQLTEEYEAVRANTETMEEALVRKREILPELKDAYKRARERAKDAQAAMEQQENLQGLKDQLVWSYVEEVEDQIEFASGKIAEEGAKGAAFEETMRKLQNELDDLANDIKVAKEAEAESKTALEKYKPQLENLQLKIKANKLRLQKWKDTERNINSNITLARNSIRDLDAQIAQEEAKLSRDIEAERAPLRAAIESANEELSKIEVRDRQAKEQIQTTTQEYQVHKDSYENFKEQIGNARRQQDTLQATLNNIRAMSGNQMSRYGGPTTAQLVQAIRADRSWREMPIGPMGLHVKLNHPEYAKVLDSFFSHYLNGYVCAHPEDVRKLRGMIKRYNVSGETMVLCLKYDPNFDRDLQQGEPAPQILTILRALTIDNDFVRQALINSNMIEKIALVQRRPDGDALMRTDPRNVNRAFSADMYAIRHAKGKSSSVSISEWRSASRLGVDDSHKIASIQEDINRIEHDVRAIEVNRLQAGKLAAAAEQQKRAFERSIVDMQNRRRKLERDIGLYTEQLTEEQPNNISALMSSKQEYEENIANAQEQYRAGLEQKLAQDEDLAPDVERSNQLTQEIATAEGLAQKIQASLYLYRSSTSRDLQSNSMYSHARAEPVSKLEKDQHTARLARYEAEAANLRSTLEDRTTQALTICTRPQVDKRKGAKKLQKEIDSIEKALKEREKRQGATLEQILEELEVRKRTAQDAIRQTNDLAKMVNQLEKAYESRTSKWTDFRSHICHRAKMQFVYYLSNRGYHGKLKFDHERTQLHLAVQTDADKGTDKAKRKEAAALSGGEKSFSTICLLLTMWEAVGCPLRCLDEFDVFMDAVNRRIAMNMMIDTAKAAVETQFILITPQDMGSIAWGEEVKVSKLGDPKRGKGALAAGR